MRGIEKLYGVMIVGAGFAGFILAERFVSGGRTVLLDRRPYPVLRPENAVLYARYQALAGTPGVSLGGLLATYRHYNMDQVIGQALATFARLTKRDRSRQTARIASQAAP